jgi:hypothetical protein
MALVLKTSFKLDSIAITRLLIGETGPVLRFLRSVTREVRNRAVLEAPVDTGNLRNSIYEEVRVDRRAILALVGAKASYAEYVHEGTRPHTIVPRKTGGVLAFKIDGVMVFATKVHHPGTAANPFLARAVEAVGRTRGFRVTRT